MRCRSPGWWRAWLSNCLPGDEFSERNGTWLPRRDGDGISKLPLLHLDTHLTDLSRPLPEHDEIVRLVVRARQLLRPAPADRRQHVSQKDVEQRHLMDVERCCVRRTSMHSES